MGIGFRRACALVAIGLSSAAGAQSILFNSPDGTISTSNPASGMYEVTVTSGSGTVHINGIGVGGVVAEQVLIHTGTADQVNLSIVDNAVDETGGLASVWEIRKGSGSGRVAILEVVTRFDIGCDGGCDGDPDFWGLIEGVYIGEIESRLGSIYGDIRAISGSTGGLSSNGEKIDSVQSQFGDIRANITAASGRINRIRAPQGTIGTAVGGGYATIESSQGLDLIEAEFIENVYIDFSGGSVPDIGADLDVIRATGVRDPQDPFVGPGMSAYIIADEIYTLEAEDDAFLNITLETGVRNSNWVIGRDLVSGSDIYLPTQALTNQIIVNQKNHPGGSDWDGDIQVGTVQVTQDSEGIYTQTPAQIGGGAIGLAPFAIHATGCIPNHTGDEQNPAQLIGASWDLTSTQRPPPCIETSPQVKLRFFGRVDLQGFDPMGLPYDTEAIYIEKKIGNDWVDYYDSASMPPERWFPSIFSQDNSRSILIGEVGGGNWYGLGLYRIRPRDGRVISAEVEGEPSVRPFIYYVEFTGGCSELILESYNCNGDSTLCSADLAAWAANPVDFNGDSLTNVEDMAELMRAIDMYADLQD